MDVVETADAGVGGNLKCCSAIGGLDWARSTMGVSVAELRFMSMVGPSLVFGFAGNVMKGPSLTERLLGGRPRSFPVDDVLLLGQAEDTAGP